MAWKVRRLELLASLLVAGAVACAGRSANTSPASAPGDLAAQDDIATALMEHHRYHHHGGVTLFIAMSLDTLGVSPEQRAVVERVRGLLQARLEPARIAEQNLLALLADALVAGSLDQTKVDAAMTQVSAAAATVHDASVDALNQLHAALTPTQRSTLVDKAEAHWRIWRQANVDTPLRSSRDDSYLATLAGDLDLTPDQLEKMRAGIGERANGVPRLDTQGVEEQLQVFGEAFRRETFDAALLPMAGRTDAQIVAWGATHTVHFVATAMLVLSPDQRSALAQTLREHATHGATAQATE